MAEDYVLQTAPVSRKDKFLKALIVIAAICLAAELVWLLGITPFKPFLRIDISGPEGISRDEIFARAGLTGTASYFSTDAGMMEKSLLSFNTIESVKVLKHFPDRLQIILEGRKAVASVLANVNGVTVPVFFDSQGVVFRIGRSEGDEILSAKLPVVSGLVVENPYPGMRLPAMFITLFRELEKIQASAPALLEAVSEIRINRKAFDSFDIVLYPVHKRISVRLSELNEDLLRYSILMVDVLASKDEGIESLDFRSGIASYKSLEAHSE